jgi:predicted permease
MLKRLRSRLRAGLSRRNFEEGMNEEIHFHLEQYTKHLVRSGVPVPEARRRAALEFGSLNTAKEECRRVSGLSLFDEFRRELDYAVRLLRKSPGFTITTLVTLALCLGVNLTIFAALDSVLLRPLPFPEANRLVSIFNTYPKAGVERDGSSLTNYYERRGRIPAFSNLAIYRYGTAIIGDTGSTAREETANVSPEFFATLGRGVAMGRTFSEKETTFQTDQVAILTNSFWREHFGADPHAIGESVRVDGVPRTIVGILPPNFRFLSSKARLYFPLSFRPEDRTPNERHSGGNYTHMIARLRPDASLEQAQSQIDEQNAALEQDDPKAKMMADAGFRSLLVPLQADHVASIRPTLFLLEASVFLLLLIGTANLMNLLLVRANSRVKELAVRRALGASAGHLISEAMVETGFLTLLGGLLGCGVASLGIRLLNILGADRLPLGSYIAFNTRLAFFAFLGVVGLGIVLAIPLAWFNLHNPLGAALLSETRGGFTGRTAQKLRHTFTVAQVALAFILSCGAGLLAVSLKNAMAVAPGFRPDHVLSGQISLPFKTYPAPSAGLAFTDRLIDGLQHQPGIVAAGIVSNLPFSGRNGKSAATIKGRTLRRGEPPRGHYSYGAAGDYFRVLGFSLREGRFLAASDSHRSERVCVVDDDFARYYWPHKSAIGQRLFQGSQPGQDRDAFTIVGVVSRVKQAGLTDEEAQGAVYYPYSFYPTPDFFVVARTSLPPDSLSRNLQRTVRGIDADLPVTSIQSMDTRISDSLVTQRSPTILAALFAIIAIILTAVGTYGVLSFAVGQRRREIGVRMALGAKPSEIRWLFLSAAAKLVTAGLVFGIGGSLMAGRAMRSTLFHVPAMDTPIFAGAALILSTVALLACLLPSQRAARISPVKALND